MALKFNEAYSRVGTFAESPCEVDVADEELWGLQGGILQAVVFHWPSVAQERRERFFQKLWGDKVGPYLRVMDGQMELANDDLVPFAMLGRPGLHEDGFTFDAVLDSKLEGVLFFDLQRGNPSTCPVLLWDFKRFGKVAGDAAGLKLRLASMGGTVSGVGVQIPTRTFVSTRDGQTQYWQIEVKGRTARMQRGRVVDGQKDWATNEPKQGDFPSSAEAKAKAEQLIQKYLRDGYVETRAFDEVMK